MMSATYRLALLVLSALLAACVATPQASSPEDAAAKRFEPVPGQAVIYVYRQSFVDFASVLRVGERTIGETLPGTYFRILTAPGPQRLQGIGSDTGKLDLDVAPGGVYFVLLSLSGSQGDPRSTFTRVSPEDGKAELLRCCTLQENYAPGQRRVLF